MSIFIAFKIARFIFLVMHMCCKHNINLHHILKNCITSAAKIHRLQQKLRVLLQNSVKKLVMQDAITMLQICCIQSINCIFIFNCNRLISRCFLSSNTSCDWCGAYDSQYVLNKPQHHRNKLFFYGNLFIYFLGGRVEIFCLKFKAEFASSLRQHLVTRLRQFYIFIFKRRHYANHQSQ